MHEQNFRKTSRRRVFASTVGFDADELAGCTRLEIDEPLAEDIIGRIESGASIEEIGNLLGMRVENENHPLARRNPLYHFLTYGGEGDADTLVYFPDEDAFRLGTPNYLYGDEDGELVEEYVRDCFGDGVVLEVDIGFELVFKGGTSDRAIDDMIDDLDGVAFSMDTGTLELRRFGVDAQRDEAFDREVSGGCLARVKVQGDEAIEALFGFYDGDLYADARRKDRKSMRAWIRDICETHALRTLREEFRVYCKSVAFLDVV